LLGDRLEIEQKSRRLVIGRGAAPLDFGIDLAPDALASPRDRQAIGRWPSFAFCSK